MANRVVSTKLNEEEHRRIMEICNTRGITVSKLLKKTLLERIREEKERKRSTQNFRNPAQKSFQEPQRLEQSYKKKENSFRDNHDRFMYY